VILGQYLGSWNERITVGRFDGASWSQEVVTESGTGNEQYLKRKTRDTEGAVD
jgi:hypothetical protein